MKSRKYIMVITGLFLLILKALSITPVQAEKGIPYVESFHLDVKTLTMNPGEKYDFHVVYEPANTLFGYLNWVSTDSDVVVVEDNTVKALTPGRVWLYAETFDHRHSETVEVIVNGEPAHYRNEEKGAEPFLLLSDGDIAKIEDSGFASYVSFIRQLGIQKDPVVLGKMDYPSYSLYFDVARENHEEFIAQAEMLGLEEVSEFTYSDEIVVSGSADKLAALLAGNYSVQLVRTNDLLFTVDPEKSDTAKGITLKGNADIISNFSAAHDAGLDGEGAVVAVLDTGIMSYHEFFREEDGSNRVAYQQCYSTTSEGSTASVCKDGAKSAEGDAYPYLPENTPYTLLYSFSHGTHVAGIAAGNGGVAPRAKLAMVAVFSLIYKDGKPFSSGCYNSDLSQGLEKILEWYDNGANITSVNLSLGSYGKGSINHCDQTYPDIFNLFEEMRSRGIQITVSSGNERYYADYQSGWVGWPACYSNVTAVGALTDSETPQVAAFSNHGEIVDILAPGSYVNSAVINDSGSFGTMSGTSQAAPMVAGTYALTYGHLGVKEGEEAADTLIAMSTKTASVDDVTKTVLDLTHIAEYTLDRPVNLKVEYPEAPVSAVLSWGTAANAEGYEFFYKKRTDEDWAFVENGNSTQYTIENLDPDHAYDVKVRSWRTSPAGDSRLYSEFTLLSFSKNLSSPEGIRTASYGNVLAMLWTISPQAESYTVYYREIGTSEWSTADTTGTTWKTSEGIKSGKTYEVKVSARKASAEVESEIRTLSTTTLWQKGTVPTIKSTNFTSATLEWTAVPGVSGYRVSMKKTSESDWQEEAIVEDTSRVFTGLDGSELTFRVCAMFASGAESCSSVTLPELPVEAKSVLDFEVSITAQAGTVTLNWPAAADADGYYIYMYNADSKTWKRIMSVSENEFSMYFMTTPQGSLQYGIKPVKFFHGIAMLPDEMLTTVLTPSALKQTETRTETWDMETVHPQAPTFYLLGR